MPFIFGQANIFSQLISCPAFLIDSLDCSLALNCLLLLLVLKSAKP